MKRKLITLMTLLLCVCSGAWADVLISASFPTDGISSTNTTGQAVTGGTFYWSGINATAECTVGTVGYYKPNSDNAYVQLKLTSGNFQAGDVLTISVSTNGDNKTCGVKFFTSKNTATVTGVNKGSAKDVVYTLLAADIEEDGSIKMLRNSSNDRWGAFSVTGTRKTIATQTLAGVKVGETTLTEDAATAGYSVSETTITLTNDQQSATTPDNVKLVNHIVYTDESTEDEDVDVSFDGTVTDGYYVGTATINETDYTVRVKNVVTSPTSSTIFSYTVTDSDVTTYGIAAQGVTTVASMEASGTIGGACNFQVSTDGNNNKKGYFEKANNNTIPVYTINGAAGYVIITLSDEEDKFQMGDVISIYGSVGSSGNGFNINTSNSTSNALASTTYTSASTFGTVTATIDESRANQRTLYIMRTGSATRISSITVTRPSSTTITTNKGGWASFTPEWNCTLSDGATAYIITGVDALNSTVETSAVEVLKAGEGYFVNGDAQTTITATATETAATSTTNNMIVGCTSETVITASSPNSKNKYVLGTATSGTYNGQSGLFLVDSSITVGAGKAYLQTNDETSARFLAFELDDATGIQQVERTNVKAEGYYNLNGQRVSQPTKGLYIMNGKKVLVK